MLTHKSQQIGENRNNGHNVITKYGLKSSYESGIVDEDQVYTGNIFWSFEQPYICFL